MKCKTKLTVSAEIEEGELIRHLECVIDEDSPPSISFDEWARQQCFESMLEEMLDEMGCFHICEGRIDPESWGEVIASKYRDDCC